MRRDSINAFLTLVRAGLWEQECQLLPLGQVDYAAVQQLAEEQSVVGIVAAGFDHVADMKAPQEVVLQFVGQALQLAQRNREMNTFIEGMIDRMRKADIYTLLVKGQGIAQCYERPMWRASGDVDLFLDDDNYEKAKGYLIPLASNVEKEGIHAKHLGLTIDSWIVELHGKLRCSLSHQANQTLEEIQDVIFKGDVRSWMNGHTQVLLPGADCDVIYVFAHYLNHFYKGGIGIRQICDWCRLLWKYREEIDRQLLEKRLRKMGLVTEWKAFGAFAVDELGMPAEAMPLYSPDKKWSRKAERICAFIMEVGNFGHNRDSGYFEKYPYLIRKVFSLARRCSDLARHARIFPLDSLRFFPYIVFNGLRSAARGE